MNNSEKIAVVRAVAEAVEGEVYERYSGRGMFGAECLGVVCSLASVAMEEAVSRGLRGARVDSMGLDAIVYWPSVKPEAVEEEAEVPE